MKIGWNGRTPYTVRINHHVLLGWYIYSKFAYGDVLDLLKVYCGKDCMETSIDHIEPETKKFYETFPKQSKIPLTEVLQRNYNEATKFHTCVKSFNVLKNNQKGRIHCHYTDMYGVHSTATVVIFPRSLFQNILYQTYQ